MPVRSSASKFAKDSLILLSANAVGFAGSLARGFIVPGFLTVASYGNFNFMLSLSPLFMFIAGCASASIPVLLTKKGSGEPGQGTLINSGLGLICSSYLFISITVIFSLVLYRTKAPDWFHWVLIAFTFTYFVQEIGNFIYGIARTREHFHILSIGSLLFNLGYLVLSISLTYYHGFIGLVLSFLAANLVLTVFYLSRGYAGWPAFPLWKNIREMVRLGLQMNISTVISGFIAQVDRYVIMFLVGSTGVGLYALAFQVGLLGYVALNSMIQVLSTKIYLECAKPREESRISEIYRIGVFAYSALAIVMGSILFFAAEPVIRIFLPKYIESIPLIRVLVWSPFFQTISNITAMVIIGTRGVHRLNVFLAIIGIFAIGIYFLQWRWFGLPGVCMGALMVGCVICFLHVKILVSNIGKGKSVQYYLLPPLLLLAYAMLTSWLVESMVVVDRTGSFFHLSMLTLKKIGFEMVLLTAGVAAMLYFNREIMTSGLKIIRPAKP
jgi:O-antigen/teichoic acid export membrane protein